MRMYLATVLAALLLAPLASARFLTGTGPAYWQEPARYPMHYPAAQAAVEGFVFNPMGGPSYCNARLVKPGKRSETSACFVYEVPGFYSGPYGVCLFLGRSDVS